MRRAQGEENMFGLNFLDWGSLIGFIVGTAALIPRAQNWAGMTLQEAERLTGEFDKQHRRGTLTGDSVVKMGYPPFRLGDKLDRHGDVSSSGGGMMLFILNLVLGIVLAVNYKSTFDLPTGISLLLIVEYLALRWVGWYQRQLYLENFEECMRLYEADARMVGKLIDHNARKKGMELPRSGRILTLRVHVRDSGFTSLEAGFYEMDLWLPVDKYREVFRGVNSGVNLFESEVTVFYSPCQGNPLSPADVHHMIVGVHRQVFGLLVERDVISTGGTLRRIDPQVADSTLDEYVLRRAAREANC